jgi:hypothetical protein
MRRKGALDLALLVRWERVERSDVPCVCLFYIRRTAPLVFFHMMEAAAFL